MDKSYVRVLRKQGVSKGSTEGFEIELKICKGDDVNELVELGKEALKGTQELKKTPFS